MLRELSLSSSLDDTLWLMIPQDGTGNQFTGKDTDSNILKVYRLLDRTQPMQFTWYNPGLGTYVQSASLDHETLYSRFKSWYIKTRDQAIGTNLGDHVMAGYRFLMRYYNTDDDIYIFGFSRGSYTARFLAEMLDHIGLLSAGNEELERFAWQSFSKWQSRKGGTSTEDRNKTHELYLFMKTFRETFSRPIRRIRFLGLFDTVNSCPRFENAWLQRTKYPYTARTSAKTIRSAVSIDERRAKFRVDLFSGLKRKRDEKRRSFHRYQSDLPARMEPQVKSKSKRFPNLNIFARAAGKDPASNAVPQHQLQPSGVNDSNEHILPPGPLQGQLPEQSHVSDSEADTPSPAKQAREAQRLRRRFSFDKDQDILEVWFAGNHGDIGGGWEKEWSETWQLAHGPLVWMVNEASKAGLKFDPEKMAALKCSPDIDHDSGQPTNVTIESFHKVLDEAATTSFLHDALEFGGGLNWFAVLAWKCLEYLPFRRMDLQEDGSWNAIRWPLPKGEVRDIPRDAKVHVNVIKRMQHDPSYRPGNLIMLGSGGRGQREAPESMGMGEWVIWANKDDPVSELFVSENWAREQAAAAANGSLKQDP